MTEARRSFLRDVMHLAWRKFRFERGAFTFGSALRHAWAWFKGEAARKAAAERYRSAPQHREIVFRHTAQSPIRRSLTGKAYAFTLARDAGRLTSRLGA
jgi:hypothetical protein